MVDGIEPLLILGEPFTVNNNTMQGDPCPGQDKRLLVKYALSETTGLSEKSAIKSSGAGAGVGVKSVEGGAKGKGPSLSPSHRASISPSPSLESLNLNLSLSGSSSVRSISVSSSRVSLVSSPSQTPSQTQTGL